MDNNQTTPSNLFVKFSQSILDKCKTFEDVDIEVIKVVLEQLLDKSINGIISDTTNKNESVDSGNNLYDVAFTYYTEAISNKNDISKIKQFSSAMSSTFNLLEYLFSKIGVNSGKCFDYITNGLDRYQAVNILVKNTDLIIKIISLPSEIGFALDCNEYDRVFDLISFSNNLNNYLENIPFLSKTKHKVEYHKQHLHDLLCKELGFESNITHLAKYVSLLKKINMTSELDIKRTFIEKRSNIINNKILHIEIDPSDPNLAFSTSTDIMLKDSYEFVVYYKRLFGSLDNKIAKVIIDIIIKILNIIKNSYNFRKECDSNAVNPDIFYFSNNMTKLLEICKTYSSIGLDFTCLVYSTLR